MGELRVVVRDFRPYRGDRTLRGFLTLRVPAARLELRNVALHEEDGRRWIAFPGRPFKDADGATTGWHYHVAMYGPRAADFEEAVFEALETYLALQKGADDNKQLASNSCVGTRRR